MAGLHHAGLRGVVGAEVSPASAFREEGRDVRVGQLPTILRQVAELWFVSGARVIARLDDANEWRVAKLKYGEEPWVGWRLVKFHE